MGCVQSYELLRAKSQLIQAENEKRRLEMQADAKLVEDENQRKRVEVEAEEQRKKKLIEKYRYQVIILNDDISRPIDFHLYRGCGVVSKQNEKTQMWEVTLNVRIQAINKSFVEYEERPAAYYFNITEVQRQEQVVKLQALKKKIEAAYLVYLQNTEQMHLAGGVQEEEIVMAKPVVSVEKI